MEASASVLSWLRCRLKMATLGTLGWVRMIHIRSGLAEGCWCVKGAQAGEMIMARPLTLGLVKGLESTSKPKILREKSLGNLTSCSARKSTLVTTVRYEVREDSLPLAPLQLKVP